MTDNAWGTPLHVIPSIAVLDVESASRSRASAASRWPCSSTTRRTSS